MGALGALGTVRNPSILFKSVSILFSESYTGVGVAEKSYANAASTSKQNVVKAVSSPALVEY